jgi:futalosine hydrolase
MASYEYYFIFRKIFLIWSIKRTFMQILFLAAVEFELNVARALRRGGDDRFLCGGMGPEATRRTLEAEFSAGRRFDLAVNLGIAGSYVDCFPVGRVVQVVREQYGGQSGALLANPAPPELFAALPQVTGNTVPALEARYRSVEAEIETMEGAAFFETCLRYGIPFAEIRAVSNRVGEEDRSRWDIPLALRNLQDALQPLSC